MFAIGAAGGAIAAQIAYQLLYQHIAAIRQSPNPEVSNQSLLSCKYNNN
jgi:hypothetical protein